MFNAFSLVGQSKSPRSLLRRQPLVPPIAIPVAKFATRPVENLTHATVTKQSGRPQGLETAKIAGPAVARAAALAPAQPVAPALEKVAPPAIEAQILTPEGDVHLASVRPGTRADTAPVSVPATLAAPAASPPAGSADIANEQPARSEPVAAVKGSAAPSATMVFKPIGYVEKAGGQLEAIIVQENEPQVVHTGDLIAGRYRVTRISPDAVDTVDEILGQMTMAKPDTEVADNSLGYIQSSDGHVESIVSDGESVRLVPETPTVAMAQVGPAPSIAQNARPVGEDSSPFSTITKLAPGPNAAKSPQNENGTGGSVSGELTSDVSPVAADEPAAPLANAVPVETAAVAMAKDAPPEAPVVAKFDGLPDDVTSVPVRMKPLGFAVDGDGQLSAILAQGNDVYLVRAGDRFAGQYRAVSVSAEAVDAVEEPPRQLLPPADTEASAFPNLLAALTSLDPHLPSGTDRPAFGPAELGGLPPKVPDDPLIETALPPPKAQTPVQPRRNSAKSAGRESASKFDKTTSSSAPTTFVFETLGYIETEDEGFKAVVADGTEVYLVKQGDTFAEQYRATSVDPSIVLAVKVPPGQETGNSLSAQTESFGKSASNQLYGYLHFSLSGFAGAPYTDEVDATGSPLLMNLGVNALDSSLDRY